MVGVGVRLALWIKLLRSFFGVSVAVFWPGKYERVVIVFFFVILGNTHLVVPPLICRVKRLGEGILTVFMTITKGSTHERVYIN